MAAASVLAPHTPIPFALAALAYNFLQGINYTAYSALCFQLVGSSNPLASTQFTVLFCAINLPISYMTWVDGRGYALFGLRGLFATDALFSIVAGVALLFLLSRSRRYTEPSDLSAAQPSVFPSASEQETQ